MILVPDASAIATILLPDEAGAAADFTRALCRERHLFVPNHWSAEIANILWKARRRERLDDALLAAALRIGAMLARTVTTVAEAPLDQIVTLALSCGISAYDAAYIIAAQSQNAPLLTFDRRLAEAARSQEVETLIQ
ncbi:type II toxin-antitoxin system VapC family toxin [Sphingomonas metalli]|nr:type II toxin-antitoxin system VapC family toxin [Sphingomonas metalli]